MSLPAGSWIGGYMKTGWSWTSPGVAHQPITPWWKLPIEVAEEVAAVTKALTERLASLAVELNDKA